jgi:peptide/nickel transport system substrate-binding protein
MTRKNSSNSSTHDGTAAFGTRASSSGIGRRQFIGQLTAGTALAGVALGLGSAPAQADETPKMGGHLVIGTDGASTTDSLDPQTSLGAFLPLVGMQFYDTLTDLDENGHFTPYLAESWSASPDAKQWVFKIRSGVTFHSGKSLTAADVVYSLNLHRSKDTKSAAKAYLATVTDIKASGPLEVTVTLDSGNADVPYIMTDYHLSIMPDGNKPATVMGTGPFVFDSFQPGVRCRGRRNPNYWKSGTPYVDSVETLGISDPVARQSALLSGTIHLMNRVSPKIANTFAQNPQLQLFNVSAGSHYCFPMRCDTAPFTDNNVRLALKYAIDREKIVKLVLKGYGKIGNDQPIPSYDPLFAADIPQRPYDPDKARFHMKQAGYDGPIELHVSDGAFDGSVAAAQVFQVDAARAGINLQVVREPADGYWSNVWMKKAFCASYWSGRPTADLMFSSAYSSSSPWNESFWKNQRFNDLLLAARAELDVAKRKQMYREMQLLVRDDCGELIPMFNNFLDGATRNLKGFKPSPAYELSDYRAAREVWLES